MKRLLPLCLVLLLLAGCSSYPATPPSGVDQPDDSSSSKTVSAMPPQHEPVVDESPLPIALCNDYIAQVADDLLAELTSSDMDDVQRIAAVYRHLVANTTFAEPIGLDVWRWRGNPAQKPDYVENRAISPILFGIGSCEDYAAALAVLLRRMGYPAMYVAGLTTSVEGDFVDHAWTMVELNGQWYHLDAQLEANVMADNRLTYRYFLRDDQTMFADHRWGQNLIRYYGGQSTEKGAMILQDWMTPDCAGSAPTPAAEQIEQAARPDRTRILAELKREKQQYEALHGALPPLTLDVFPPAL